MTAHWTPYRAAWGSRCYPTLNHVNPDLDEGTNRIEAQRSFLPEQPDVPGMAAEVPIEGQLDGQIDAQPPRPMRQFLIGRSIELEF